MSKETHAVKKKKTRFGLIPPNVLEKIAKILTEGAIKHGDYDWQKQDVDDFINSAYRHLVARHSGQVLDDDTGDPHAAHLAANAIFIAWHDMQKS
jgi:hypothetical protein